MEQNTPLKVAIVHDWLYGGGAERVIAELHAMFPAAPIYTSYCSDEWRKRLDNKVVTGFLQRWPFNKLRKYVGFLRIWWFTHLDFSGYDLVISSSGNGEAKGIRVPKGVKHICYCHTPTHYYWRHYDLYMKEPGFGRFNGLARFGLKMLVGPLRRWDLKASKRPDYFIANSTHIQEDIKQYYNRDSVVIFPPVDIARFAGTKDLPRSGFVMASRQVPQKKFDLAIAACNKLQVPLTIIGRGPEHERLVKMAGPTVTFPENVTDEQMATYYWAAAGFIWPCFDDFGVTPVEAMAAGTPVIAYRAGGALDYVVENRTGLFFDEQTVDSLAAQLQVFPTHQFNSQVIRQDAAHFAPSVFRDHMLSFINSVMNKPL